MFRNSVQLITMDRKWVCGRDTVASLLIREREREIAYVECWRTQVHTRHGHGAERVSAACPLQVRTVHFGLCVQWLVFRHDNIEARVEGNG